MDMVAGVRRRAVVVRVAMAVSERWCSRIRVAGAGRGGAGRGVLCWACHGRRSSCIGDGRPRRRLSAPGAIAHPGDRAEPIVHRCFGVVDYWQLYAQAMNRFEALSSTSDMLLQKVPDSVWLLASLPTLC